MKDNKILTLNDWSDDLESCSNDILLQCNSWINGMTAYRTKPWTPGIGKHTHFWKSEDDDTVVRVPFSPDTETIPSPADGRGFWYRSVTVLKPSHTRNGHHQPIHQTAYWGINDLVFIRRSILHVTFPMHTLITPKVMFFTSANWQITHKTVHATASYRISRSST